MEAHLKKLFPKLNLIISYTPKGEYSYMEGYICGKSVYNRELSENCLSPSDFMKHLDIAHPDWDKYKNFEENNELIYYYPKQKNSAAKGGIVAYISQGGHFELHNIQQFELKYIESILSEFVKIWNELNQDNIQRK